MNKKDNELISKLDRLYLDLPICSVDLASCVYEASIRMVELIEENEIEDKNDKITNPFI
jgi:hypothetical protein